jgi:hypothetical protein
MVAAKLFTSLLLIAAAGMFDAERGRARGAPSGHSSAGMASTTPTAKPAAADAATVRQAVLAALTERLQADLADPSIAVSVETLVLGQPNGAILAADGTGQVSLGAGGQLPVRFDADWSPGAGRLERIDYTVTPSAPVAPVRASVASRADQPALRAELRKAIATRVEASLRAEFANQPSRFELLGVERVESGRRRMVVSGSGITHFDGEGAAFTRFNASLDKFDGRVLHVEYELLEDVGDAAIASR